MSPIQLGTSMQDLTHACVRRDAVNLEATQVKVHAQHSVNCIAANIGILTNCGLEFLSFETFNRQSNKRYIPFTVTQVIAVTKTFLFPVTRKIFSAQEIFSYLTGYLLMLRFYS